MISRQARRAQEREATKPKHQAKDWRAALAAPEPDPPHRERACAKVIAQQRGHRSDWR